MLASHVEELISILKHLILVLDTDSSFQTLLLRLTHLEHLALLLIVVKLIQDGKQVCKCFSSAISTSQDHVFALEYAAIDSLLLQTGKVLEVIVLESLLQEGVQLILAFE